MPPVIIWRRVFLRHLLSWGANSHAYLPVLSRSGEGHLDRHYRLPGVQNYMNYTRVVLFLWSFQKELHACSSFTFLVKELHACSNYYASHCKELHACSSCIKRPKELHACSSLSVQRKNYTRVVLFAHNAKELHACSSFEGTKKNYTRVVLWVTSWKNYMRVVLLQHIRTAYYTYAVVIIHLQEELHACSS